MPHRVGQRPATVRIGNKSAMLFPETNKDLIPLRNMSYTQPCLSAVPPHFCRQWGEPLSRLQMRQQFLNASFFHLDLSFRQHVLQRTTTAQRRRRAERLRSVFGRFVYVDRPCNQAPPFPGDRLRRDLLACKRTRDQYVGILINAIAIRLQGRNAELKGFPTFQYFGEKTPVDR